MLIRILTSALFAGAIAGLCAAVFQLYFLQPVLLHAEAFELGDLVHFGEASSSPAVPPFAGVDLARDGLSAVFSMLVYTGYALLLLAAMSVAEGRGARIDARTGLVWGVAAFVAVHLAPAFSLPPEVPGVATVDVAARQVWWFATAIATGLGLALLAFGRGAAAVGLAVVLILAPHVIGAPELDQLYGPAPTEVGALFAARALGHGLVAWALTGALAGYFWQRSDG